VVAVVLEDISEVVGVELVDITEMIAVVIEAVN
jgi:hypothetical protein